MAPNFKRYGYKRYAMRNRVNVYVKAIVQMLVFLTSASCFAQNTPGNAADTTLIISSTADPPGATPVNRSGKPFYDVINPTKPGLRPTALYSSDDRIFAGLNYSRLSSDWLPDSAGNKHRGFVHYSINQKAFSFGYQGIFNHAIGRWNLFVDATYDWVKWTNFFGVGNETLQLTGDNNFYRIRNKEGFLSLSLQRRLGRQSRLSITPFFQSLQLLEDDGRFLSKSIFGGPETESYKSKNFGGIRADLLLQRLNDLLLPTKGTVLSLGVTHTRNLNEPNLVTSYSAYSRFYVPVGQHWVVSVENGGATQFGSPEFYQLNSIGGNTLRGYRRERFRGETVFYNNNELHYLFNAPFKSFRGKMGVMGFVDQGRVWKKGEVSDKWHYGYGGGIILVPRQKVYIGLQYGISNERKGFHLEFRRAL